MAASGNGRKTLMDGADLDAAGLAQVVDGRLDVFGGRAERDEHGVGVVALVLR